MLVSDDAYAGSTFCGVCGRESCEDHLPARPDSEPTTGGRSSQSKARPRLRVFRAREAMAAPRPVEIVQGIITAGGVTLMPAESGTGKTFVAIDLGAAVSDGVPWHGRRTRQGSVVYVPFEGDAIGLRLRALAQHGRRLDHLYVVPASEPLSPLLTRDGEMRSSGERALVETLGALRDELAADGRPPIVLVVIDTARASMTGPEESSEHVSAYIRAPRRLMADLPGTGTLIVHHAGWQDGQERRQRERGSSAWRGNCDAVVYLEAGEYDAARGEAELTLRTLKVRDIEPPAPLGLIRRRVELPDLATDDPRDGPLTSCVIERDVRTREDLEAERARTTAAAQRATDLQVLRALHEQRPTSVDALRTCLSLRREVVRDAIARILMAGWAKLPERQRQPYGITETGHTVLAETSGS